MNVMIPVSIGELIDKITILQIKQNKTDDKIKLANIEYELKALNDILSNTDLDVSINSDYIFDLLKINEGIWELEDNIRKLDKSGDIFVSEYIRLARNIHIENDRRAAVKKLINDEYGSEIVEEKIY